MVDKLGARGTFHTCNGNSPMLEKNIGRQNNMGGCSGNCKGNCHKMNMDKRHSSGNHCNNDCKKLMERLREIDFSLIDTVLYLDAYPHSCEALGYYNKLKEEREEVIKILSMSCNKPITFFDNYGDAWSWTDGPWPWEACAN